jgi:hypothetical protein
MTRTTNARLAGFTYLFYIAVAFPGMILFNRATSGDAVAAKLAHIAEHASDVRIAILLSLLSGFTAMVLGVALYGLTRDEDQELAVLALSCRVGEGVLSAISIIAKLGLLWLGTATGADAPDTAAAHALGAFLLKVTVWNVTIAATLFSVGSTLFSYLLLRGRMIPVPLAWLGIVASVLLVVSLPLQLIGFFGGLVGGLIWLPMLVFEVAVALWLLIKGAGSGRRDEAAA